MLPRRKDAQKARFREKTLSRIESNSSTDDLTAETATTSTGTGTATGTAAPPEPIKGWLSPTVSLPILVFVDMFAVSLVVPLLFQYYKKAGVTSANQREMLSSVFSTSQIVGGLLLGFLTDAHWLSRKTTLFISFAGSFVGYAMIGWGNFPAMILSRVLVGLVKQTMTVTTSLLTQYTTDANRAQYMGRLESSLTAAWIVGPSTGAVLFKYVHHSVPALLACTLFLLDMVLAAVLLTDTEQSSTTGTTSSSPSSKSRRKGNFWHNLQSCFRSPELGSVIASTILVYWVNLATSYASMGSYYEDMYGMEPHHRGYVQSYQRVLGFIVQSFLIGPILNLLGGERRAVCAASILLAIATFWEMQRSVPIFVLALSPAISVSVTILKVSLRSLLTRVAPQESLFSVFAVLDVLQNASAVTVPFYRTFLFRLLQSDSQETTTAMEGDPDPVSWAFASGIHWVLATLAVLVLLRPEASMAPKKTP
eukprot:Nitzschia sp. Nitz4//scaffold56_size114212//62146//63582//NITZ4_003952-RA/size114212-processed-gene-0.39-mRNA-1//1//CDS//3329554712//2325//frame0